MYGYFDYRNTYLRNNERIVFTSYYCRLCYCFWNIGGQKARYLTTYDAALYNLVVAIAGFDSCPPNLPCERVKTNNKKLFQNDKIGNLMADLSLIGFAVKVKDDETDGDGKRAFIARLLFKKLLKRATTRHRELFEKSYATIVEMDRLQREKAPIEVCLDLYANTMAEGFRYFFTEMEEKYLRLIRAMARWIFLIDMIDDYNKDVKNGAVNSLYREDSPTVQILFQKHYYELIPLVQKVGGELNDALNAVECDMVEWVVLHKILGHSLATLVPGILEGKDMKYHYFRDTIAGWKRVKQRDKSNKKYEKNSMHH